MRKALICVGLALLIAATPWVFGHPDISRATLEARYGSPPSQFLVLPGGTRAHIRDRGPRDGQTLVLIHGSTDSLLTWEPWVRRLSDTFRIVTLDLPGHGLTGAVGSNDYSEEAMVTFVGEAANALRLEMFAIGGNSMGGRIAARFAEEHPSRVTHLILVDASGLSKSGTSIVNVAFSLLSKPVLARPLLNIAPRWLVDTIVAQAVSRKEVMTKERINAFWDLNHMEGTREATIRRFRTASSRVKDHLGDITAPCLILWGEDDRIVSVDAGRAFHAAIRNSQLVVYPKTGHLPQEEMVDDSAARVRAFLTATQDRASGHPNH